MEDLDTLHDVIQQVKYWQMFLLAHDDFHAKLYGVRQLQLYSEALTRATTDILNKHLNQGE